MNKEQRAHEYALKMLENLNPMQLDKPTRDGIAYECFELADAMQAEADKRKVSGIPDVLLGANGEVIAIKTLEETYPEYAHGIDYPSDAWVMYKGEKRLAVSIKDEWQPDWSQAPDGFNRFVIGSPGGHGFFTNIEPEFQGDYYYIGSDGVVFHNHGYKGDWENSLRKRPHGE